MTDGRDATIIAYYGADRPPPLTELLQALQERLGEGVGAAFRPRPLADVHATVVGLEGAGKVDLPGLCGYLRERLTRFPLCVQFGGFADRDHRLTSRGSRLYDRMLTVRGDKVVLIGWPVDEAGEPTGELDALRRALGAFGAHHRYFDTPDATDPDAYMVLGELSAPQDGALAQCLAAGRTFLAATPCRVSLTADDVRLATYADPRLPAASTTTWPLGSVVTAAPGTRPGRLRSP